MVNLHFERSVLPLLSAIVEDAGRWPDAASERADLVGDAARWMVGGVGPGPWRVRCFGSGRGRPTLLVTDVDGTEYHPGSPR